MRPTIPLIALLAALAGCGTKTALTLPPAVQPAPPSTAPVPPASEASQSAERRP